MLFRYFLRPVDRFWQSDLLFQGVAYGLADMGGVTCLEGAVAPRGGALLMPDGALLGADGRREGALLGADGEGLAC